MWSELPIGSASLQDVFADQLLLQGKMLGGAIITGDSTGSSSRAIIKNMQIIVEGPVENFVGTLVLILLQHAIWLTIINEIFKLLQPFEPFFQTIVWL